MHAIISPTRIIYVIIVIYSVHNRPQLIRANIPSPSLLDLSYRNHLSSKIVASHLHQFLTNQIINQRDGLDNVAVVDISNTNFDDGSNALQTLNISLIANDIAATKNNTSTKIGIDLIAHSDQLTSRQVGTFLNQIWEESFVDTNTTVATLQVPSNSTIPKFFWRSVDFGWNLLYNSASSTPRQEKNLNNALQKLIGNPSKYNIQALKLCCCGLGPAACRSIAKGLLHRFEISDDTKNSTPLVYPSPLLLDLSNNQDIGDSGAAAIAAAIRSIVGQQQAPIITTLDLSACNVGDIGIEALTLALDDAIVPVMISQLKVCHNRITDRGALTLGHVLHRNIEGIELHIDLSNNPLITDRGIASLLSAVEKGCLSKLVLRSCSVQADGAEMIGRMLRSIAMNSQLKGRTIEIDLSGNPIGLLRGKSDKSNMKEKAGAAASAYVSQGLNFLKKGFGSVGGTFTSSESDDDEDTDSNEKSDATSNMRCGFKSMANAFIGTDKDEKPNSHSKSRTTVRIGLRRTFCDTAGADALAAMIIATKDVYQNLDLRFDLDLNPVVEEEMIDAIYGRNSEALVEMAERHNEAMDIIRQANERAVAAAQVLAARRRQVAASSAQFDDYGYEQENDFHEDDDDDGFDDSNFDENDSYDDPWDSDSNLDEEY